MNFYAKLSNKVIDKAASLVKIVESEKDSYMFLSNQITDEQWESFYKFWSKNTGEFPRKMNMYMPHNCHWILEYLVKKFNFDFKE
jgi:hypothetical protein